jgi:pimeloyl-ACP methyl ester carboxylesterase
MEGSLEMNRRVQVICLPGGVAPAAQRYASLAAATAARADLHLKDLEVYRDAAPPADYSIDLELSAVDRFADSLRLDRFHLVGYSGGGFISLAYAGTRPARLLSLALFEPAMVPGEPTSAESEATRALETKLSGLTGPEFMAAFVRAQIKPGAELPAPLPPSPEMSKRPAGIAALLQAFTSYRADREQLRKCTFPVYYGYGDQTHDVEAVRAGVLAQLFGDIHVTRFAGVHHFAAADRIYTPEHARSLIDLWHRAEPNGVPA